MKASAYRRGGALWLVGRLGILVCFGIMPFFRICYRVKYHVDYSTFDQLLSNAHIANDRGDIESADHWLKETDLELKRVSKK